jgi:hypothetical protein
VGSNLTNKFPFILCSPHIAPSLRVTGYADDNRTHSFPPFTAVTTTNVLCDPNSNLDDAKNRFILGRPLWKASLDQSRLGDSYRFAVRKLFGGIVPPDDT